MNVGGSSTLSKSTHTESTGQKLIRVTGLQNKKMRWWRDTGKFSRNRNYQKVQRNKENAIKLCMTHGKQQQNKSEKGMKSKTNSSVIAIKVQENIRNKSKGGEDIIQLTSRLVSTYCESISSDWIFLSSGKEWLDMITQLDTKRHMSTDLWGKKLKMKYCHHSSVNSPVSLKSLNKAIWTIFFSSFDFWKR